MLADLTVINAGNILTSLLNLSFCPASTEDPEDVFYVRGHRGSLEPRPTPDLQSQVLSCGTFLTLILLIVCALQTLRTNVPSITGTPSTA